MLSFVKSLTSHEHFAPFAAVAVLVEVVLSTAIVLKVPYTEIDWRAYMDEVGGVLDGDFDYLNLRGETGPLVYPAGFVWVYAPLHWVTGGGANVRLAQFIFVALIAFNLFVVLRIYNLTRFAPPWVALFFLCSKRVHSLFVLRLFNDCVTATVFHVALLLMCEAASVNATKGRSEQQALRLRSRYWIAGCALFSAAVSIKMNILLMAPALFFTLLGGTGTTWTFGAITGMAAIQGLLGLPFLLTNFWGYVGRALDLSRVFLFKWSVNFKWLDLVVERGACGGGSSGVGAECEACAAWAARELTSNATGAVLSNMEEVCDPGSALGRRAMEIATAASGASASGAAAALSGHRCCKVIAAFKDKRLALALLAATILLNLFFAARHRWGARYRTFGVPAARRVALALLTSNLIGIALARSVHYQFYVWCVVGSSAAAVGAVAPAHAALTPLSASPLLSLVPTPTTHTRTLTHTITHARRATAQVLLLASDAPLELQPVVDEQYRPPRDPCRDRARLQRLSGDGVLIPRADVRARRAASRALHFAAARGAERVGTNEEARVASSP